MRADLHTHLIAAKLRGAKVGHPAGCVGFKVKSKNNFNCDYPTLAKQKVRMGHPKLFGASGGGGGALVDEVESGVENGCDGLGRGSFAIDAQERFGA